MTAKTGAENEVHGSKQKKQEQDIVIFDKMANFWRHETRYMIWLTNPLARHL